MKKFLLLIVSAIFAVSAMAQNVSLPFNQYSGQTPNLAFQAKVTSVIPAEYEAKVGDVITVTIAGTADYAITDFQVAFVDTRAAVSYWDEKSGFKALGPVTAGTAFSFTVDCPIVEDAAGAGSTYLNLILDGKSQAAIDASASAVALTLSTFEISIAAAEEGIISLTSNGDGTFQGEFPDTLATDPVATVGKFVKLSIAGTSNVDITSFQAVLIDGTAAANYWAQLSEYTPLGDVTAGTAFEFTSYIEVTEAPIGTGFKSQFLVINGTATETIKLDLTTFTAELVDEKPIVEEPTSVDVVTTGVSIVNGEIVSDIQIESIAVYNVTGVVVSTSASVAALQAGVYSAVVTLTNGEVVNVAIVK